MIHDSNICRPYKVENRFSFPPYNFRMKFSILVHCVMIASLKTVTQEPIGVDREKRFCDVSLVCV